MKNISIRTKILVGVVLVNLIGILVVMVYLHQSYSGSLDVTAQESASLGVATFGELQKYAVDEFDAITSPTGAQQAADSLKNVTGAEYGIMIVKTELDQEKYEAELDKAGKPSNWDERETYVLVANTDEAQADKMQMSATPDSIPEMGKIVGVENGACSKTCHGAVEGEGDFWAVKWSEDSKSRAHAVFPLVDESGKALGIAYSIEDISAQADSARSTLLQTCLVIVTGLVAATVLIALMLNAFIFRRLDRMIASMEEISVRVAGGDFNAHFEPDGTSDEIGRFEAFFARFLDLISGTLKSLVK